MLNKINPTQKVVYKKPNIDKQGRAYGTGRRKTAVAKVWIKSGKGKFVINKKYTPSEYLKNESFCTEVYKPFKACNLEGKFDVFVSLNGGGLSGQAGAIRLGISRALENFNPILRTELKKDSLLTRDARVVERKKYGRAKARKSFQFSKR
jgi:small subunit ribosomal protein S9